MNEANWLLLLTGLPAPPLFIQAQSYPAKPIRLVMTISGDDDLTARALVARLERSAGIQPE